MKKLHDLRKKLPNKSRLSIFDSLRVKGGADEFKRRGDSGDGAGFSECDDEDDPGRGD